MRCSVVMSNRDRLPLLHRVLDSLLQQQLSFAWEVIIVNHGGEAETETLCEEYRHRGLPLRYAFLPRDGYDNPAPARNLAYKMARGDVLVLQSSDVVHARPDTVARLVEELPSRGMLFARVVDCHLRPNAFQPDARGERRIRVAASPPKYRRPWFFLGSVLRRHICAVGGNSEKFTRPGGEDNYLGDCLTRGLGLRPVYTDEICGYHQIHPESEEVAKGCQAMRKLYWRLRRQSQASGVWRGGLPWPYKEGASVLELEGRKDGRPVN